MKKARTRSAFAGLLTISIAATAVAGSAEQEAYDHDVGRVQGYGMMAAATAAKCSAMFPNTEAAIVRATQQFQMQNRRALQEVASQWKAYVERDSKAANLPATGYASYLERQISRELADLFLRLGGQQSLQAQTYCEKLPSTLEAMFVETRFAPELSQMRNCSSAGTCPNLKAE
ncbi:hypothetical protein [Variovorax fucosicus]|uniref:hypothetical protein n=1 Tax=Variovorax fucosicus TaxID=3053517 RepID=UPI002574A0ED|nr:hypothetical protein [Variovorax sp. J22G47]MDM0058930.1 hypothetical protein [Variovorax sp. J22G47]